MAAATKKNQQTPPPPAPAAASIGGKAVVDPKFEWAEKAGSYVLRLALPGFRKDDFRVQVDGAGRLTVRGNRPAVTGPAGSLHKVFQLPATAAVDDITGRFQAGVLTLTVPKRDGAGAGAPPTSIEEIKRKQPDVAKESKPNEEEIAKEDALKKKAMDEATNKAKSRKQEQQKKEEDAKPKAPPARSAVASPPKKPDAAATTADKAQQRKQQEEEASKRKQEQQKPASAPAKKDENVKPDAATAPPPKHDAVTGTDKAKKEVAPESLAEKVRRRSEEEGANAAPMSAAKRAKTDGEKKATAACGGWKERVQGELKVLTDMKWADGLLEAARNNKEVVAIGIAAFSLGLLVSHKLFSK